MTVLGDKEKITLWIAFLMLFITAAIGFGLHALDETTSRIMFWWFSRIALLLWGAFFAWYFWVVHKCKSYHA